MVWMMNSLSCKLSSEIVEKLLGRKEPEILCRIQLGERTQNLA